MGTETEPMQRSSLGQSVDADSAVENAASIMSLDTQKRGEVREHIVGRCGSFEQEVGRPCRQPTGRSGYTGCPSSRDRARGVSRWLARVQLAVR
jgi:hypothetical protein